MHVSVRTIQPFCTDPCIFIEMGAASGASIGPRPGFGFKKRAEAGGRQVTKQASGKGGKAAARPAAKAQVKPKPRQLTGEVLPPEANAVGVSRQASSKPAKGKTPAKSKRASAHRSGRGGDGEHIPADRERQIVEAMASYGIPEGAIARLIGGGISEPTLRKHYRAELDSAQDKLTAKLNEALVAQALGHPAVYDEQGRLIRAEQKRYAPAAMWLLRRQDYLEDRRLEREARAQAEAQQALRDRLKIVFEFADPAEIEVLQRVFGRVAERLTEVGRL